MHGDVREVDGHTGRVSGVSMVESAGEKPEIAGFLYSKSGRGPKSKEAARYSEPAEYPRWSPAKKEQLLLYAGKVLG